MYTLAYIWRGGVFEDPLRLTGYEALAVLDPKIVEALIDVLHDNDLREAVITNLAEMGISEPELLLPELINHLKYGEIRKAILRVLMEIYERGDSETRQLIIELLEKSGLSLKQLLKDIFESILE